MRYTREDGCRAWLTHAQATPDVLLSILDAFASAEEIYDRFQKDRGKCLKPYLPLAQIDLLREQAEAEAMHRMMLTMQRLDMGIMGMDSSRYPASLRNLADPPALLF